MLPTSRDYSINTGSLLNSSARWMLRGVEAVFDLFDETYIREAYGTAKYLKGKIVHCGIYSLGGPETE